MRTLPTKGNKDWYFRYLNALTAKILHQYPENQKQSIFALTRELKKSLSTIVQLERFDRFSEIPEPRKLSNDESAHVEFNSSWMDITFENIATNFGRYGTETISSVEEAVCYSFSLAKIFNSNRIFFRGEHKFGYKLQSRAERFMTEEEKDCVGISQRELNELRRFQDEAKKDQFIKDEIKGRGMELPKDNSPEWLPIMQHYDDNFGTRLLDITTSIYTALYFACIDWNGEIDSSTDGLLYFFTQGSSGMLIKGYYYDVFPSDFDNDYDDIAPSDVRKSFEDWEQTKYFRVYKSSFASPREIAQDGLFLVKGNLIEEPQFGQGFKFRIPANAKTDIAKQLWISGYTPERILRGTKGIESKINLSKILGIR